MTSLESSGSKRDIDQLVVATVHGAQAGALTERLTGDGFYVTQVDSSGGLLHEPTVSLLIGLERSRLSILLEHVRSCCHTHTRYIPTHVETPLLEVQPLMIEA